MRVLHVIAIGVLLVVGATLVWHPVMGFWSHQRSEGRILDVIPVPQSDGLVRLRIAFEFPLRGERGQRLLQMGWGVADPRFQPLGDPLVHEERAEGVIRGLMDTDEGRVRSRTVFYRAEDPAGSAFILDETSERGNRRFPVGLVLLAAAVVWSLSLWRHRA